MHRRKLFTVSILTIIVAAMAWYQTRSEQQTVGNRSNDVQQATSLAIPDGQPTTSSVVNADWTTTAIASDHWVGVSETALLNAGEQYVDLNKSQIALVNFQDFRPSGSSGACADAGCADGGCNGAHGGSNVASSPSDANRFDTNDGNAAVNVWDSYRQPGLPGMPAPRPSNTTLPCLRSGSNCSCNSAEPCPTATCGPAPCASAPCGPPKCASAACEPVPCGPSACEPAIRQSGCGGTGVLAGIGAHVGTARGHIGLVSCGTSRCGPECGSRRQITGVDSATCVRAGEPTWNMRGAIPWEMFAQGEYVGPHRLRHQDKYRLRVDDQITLVFRITRERTAQAYKLNVGDEIRIEAVADPDLDRQLVIQPDGTITARLLGQVMASGRTTDEVRRDLEERYTKWYNEPAITVTPIKVNTKLEDLRATVDSRAGNGGQTFQVTIAPDGTIQTPGLGSVPAHGMTLEELSMEVNARYAQIVPGIEVTSVLSQRAPRFIYVVGEVAQPGRIELVGPTTVIQSIALAQGWKNGANLRNIVVFRRAEDWRLLATKVDIQGALYGTRPAPSDEIWLRDSDIVIVPKKPIKVLNDAIELIFTNGLYAAAPFFSDPIIFTDASQL